MTNFAYFVIHPRNVEEVKNPVASVLLSYRVVRKISLSRIEFQNFYTDFLVDRFFIENNAVLCIHQIPMDCILVVCRGYSWGILVVPENGGFVGMAALIYKTERPDFFKP